MRPLCDKYVVHGSPPEPSYAISGHRLVVESSTGGGLNYGHSHVQPLMSAAQAYSSWSTLDHQFARERRSCASSGGRSHSFRLIC